MPPEREALRRTVLAARIDPSAARVDEAVQAVMQSSRKSAQGGTPVVEKLVLLNRLDQAYAFAATVDSTAPEPEDTTVFFRSNRAPFRADPRFMTIALRFGLVPIWLQTDRWPDFCADRALRYDCREEAKRALLMKAPIPGQASRFVSSKRGSADALTTARRLADQAQQVAAGGAGSGARARECAHDVASDVPPSVARASTAGDAARQASSAARRRASVFQG